MVKTEASKVGIWCTVLYLCYRLLSSYLDFFFLFFVCFLFCNPVFKVKQISQQPGMIQLQS